MLWVAEYSPSQNAFHVQPLEDALKSNLRRILANDPSLDWVVFAWGDEMFVRRMLVVVKKGQKGVSLGGSREAS